MTVSDLTVASDLLKNQYRGPLRNEINQKTPLYDLLKKKTTTQGDYIRIPLVVGRNYSVASRGSTGASLPTADAQTYKKATYSVKYLYGRMQIELPAMMATRNEKGAFAELLTAELKGLRDGAVWAVNRQFHGRGDGLLATCSTTSGSTTVNVDSTAKLEAGMVIDIATLSSGATISYGSSVEIQSVDSATTFTVPDAVTTASTHGVYVAGSRNNDVSGIDYICDQDDGSNDLSTYGGIARATYSWWKSQQVDNSGVNEALSLAKMQQAWDNIEQYGGVADKSDYVIFTDHAIARKYAIDVALPDHRYNTSDGKFKKLGFGWDGLHFQGIPLMASRFSKANTMYFLNTNHIKIYDEGDWDFMDHDGAVLSRVNNEPAYEATLYRYMELCADSCNRHCRVEDISE